MRRPFGGRARRRGGDRRWAASPARKPKRQSSTRYSAGPWRHHGRQSFHPICHGAGAGHQIGHPSVGRVQCIRQDRSVSDILLHHSVGSKRRAAQSTKTRPEQAQVGLGRLRPDGRLRAAPRRPGGASAESSRVCGPQGDAGGACDLMDHLLRHIWGLDQHIGGRGGSAVCSSMQVPSPVTLPPAGSTGCADGFRSARASPMQKRHLLQVTNATGPRPWWSTPVRGNPRSVDQSREVPQLLE